MSQTLIQNGRVFDGTQAPSRMANILVEDGLIKEISEQPIHAPEAQVIDATNKWVTPGFIDNHTHYDGEVLVAPSLQESVRHGVTTVILGGCSLSFIYSNVQDCCDMFTRVEAFPREILIPILSNQKNWSTTDEWVKHIHSLPLGPNIASFIGHSDIRTKVMGIERALTKGEKPTKKELFLMIHMLEKALDTGFLGISMQHNPWDKMDGAHWSKLLPAAYSKGKERRALTEVVRRREAHLQGVPNLVNRVAALWYMAESASFFYRKKLKCSMVAMMNLKGDPYIRDVISGIASVFNKGFGADFRMQAFPVPFRVIVQGMELIIFEEFPTGALARHLSKDRKKFNETLSDPDYREKFKKHYKNKLAPKVWQKDFGDAYVLESDDQSLIGKSFTTIADERQQHPVDTFLDLVVEKNKELIWETTIGNEEPEEYGKLYNDPNGIFGFSDSGAHINNMAFYNIPLRVLKYVKDSHDRGKPLMSYEKAIWRLTKENADFFHLDTGHLAEGKRADITIINPDKLTDSIHEYHQAEFLEGCERFVNRSNEVVECVLINGQIALQNQTFTPEFGKQRFGEFLKGQHLYN